MQIKGGEEDVVPEANVYNEARGLGDRAAKTPAGGGGGRGGDRR